MHYSIFPSEMIFDDWDGAELEKHKEISYDNRQFVVEPIDEGQVKIVQLLSTDPNDFLKPEYQPGMVLKFTPQLSNE